MMSIDDNVLIGVGAVMGLAVLIQAFKVITDFLDKRIEAKTQLTEKDTASRIKAVEDYLGRIETMIRSSEDRILGRVAEIAAGRPSAVDFERLKGRVATLENLRDVSTDESSFPR